MDMKKFLFTALVVGLSSAMAFSVSAKVVLPHIFADNMVLQQQTDVKIWGQAAPNSTVVITPSWEGVASVAVKAEQDGKWMASLHTPVAGGPYTLTISDGEELVLENVLVGEVWLCSGQSNMYMRMKGYVSQPVEGAADIIIAAEPSTPIRMCTLSLVAAFTPQDDCELTPWMENEPEAVAEASATAYCFARYVQRVLNVPVGLIITSWGGSAIEAWMDRETISSGFPEFDLSYIDREEMPKERNKVPSLLYNAMLHPLIPFTIKGMLWYQGEQNCNKPEQYLKLQPAFVNMLREQWGIGDFPFYYVQISPYRYRYYYGRDDVSPYLRESQMKALDLIPNSGMAVTLDIGDYECIHPAKKQVVGQRLALLALEDTYGMKGIDSHSPIYKSWKFEDGKISVWFEVGPMGLAPLGQTLDGFEVAGGDRVFHPATAQIMASDMVEVKCEEVTEPVAVRYCFHDCATGTLFNNFGVPASSFRTDEW